MRGKNRTKRHPEEITLASEDDEVLDKVWQDLATEEKHRLASYAPVMSTLLDGLRTLDSEAIPLSDGTPVGLWWYARHYCREGPVPKKCPNEEDWSRRLTELLIKQSIPTAAERRYPFPPERYCDLVIQWPALGELWLEVKGAWRHKDSQGRTKNSSFRKHLRSAGDDLNKLCSLDGSTAKHIGLLLVGFDTTSDPISEKYIDIVESRAVRAGWIRQYQSWMDPHRIEGRIHVWLWMQNAHCEPDIFD